MNVLLLTFIVAICVACSHAIGEKIYLRGANSLYYPLDTRNGIFGTSTHTPDAGSLIIGMDIFKTLLRGYIRNERARRLGASHRTVTPVQQFGLQDDGPQVNGGTLDYTSAFSNDGSSSAYFQNRDQSMQNHPINQPTQDELGPQGFANPVDPFTERVYA